MWRGKHHPTLWQNTFKFSGFSPREKKNIKTNLSPTAQLGTTTHLSHVQGPWGRAGWGVG